MVYAVSDIHGCYDKYRKLLKKIHFGSEDTLYVLGDVIDRGPDGFKALLDMAQRPNVVNLLGNHEAMALDALSAVLNALEQGRDAALTENAADAVELWFYNGGEPSLTDFIQLDGKEAKTVLEYMQEMPLYQEVEVGERRFVLVHGGLEGFSPEKPLSEYKQEDILWARPELHTVYYPDKYVIFGHTPVQLLGIDAGAQVKICRRGMWMDIDCGCVFSDGRLGCLCLDTLEEIYI